MALQQMLWQCILAISLCAVSVLATVTTYHVEDFCSRFEIYKMDEDDVAYIKYSGGTLRKYFGRCSIEFYGRGDDYDDEFQVCVTAELFEPKDDSLQLRYAKSVTEKVKDFTINNPPPHRYCLDTDEWFYIAFDDDETKSSTDRGKVTLKVEVIKTYDSSSTIGAIVGGVIGGIVALSLLCGLAICIWNRSKRGNVQGRVITTSVTNPSQQQQQFAPIQYSAQPHLAMPSQYPTQPQPTIPTQYPTQPQPHTVQYPTQYQFGSQPPPPPQQPQENKFSQSPPAYDQLLHSSGASAPKEDNHEYETLKN